MDCRSASAADRVCDCGDGVQWPKDRKPMFFTIQRTLRGAARFPAYGAAYRHLVQPSFATGVRLGVPYAVVGFVLSMSFGVLARQAGFTAWQAIVTAAIVFAGSAQFAALAVV